MGVLPFRPGTGGGRGHPAGAAGLTIMFSTPRTDQALRPEFLFFVGIDQIKLPSLPGKGERFFDKYLLTNDRVTIGTLLDPIKRFIGSVEYDYLTTNCPALAYRRGYISEAEYEKVRDDLHRSLVNELYNAAAFVQNLWIVKDNAACIDRGWLYISYGTSHHCHNNTLGGRISSSKGDCHSVEFSSDELRHARLFKTSSISPIYESGLPTALGHKTLRYQRFMYFISGARESMDVGLKVSQYVTALEALVSSSSMEVTHQVSERVACLVESPSSGRINQYKNMKQAYNFRSKVVHGSVLKENMFDQLRGSSDYLDSLCRLLTRKYLTNEGMFRDRIESTADEIDAFFLDKLLAEA
jgi:hypothetical protein